MVKMVMELLNYENMLEQALKDGKITEDEYNILYKVREKYGAYFDALKEAAEDGMITDEEGDRLREIRREMYETAWKEALKDERVTEDESALLDYVMETLGLYEEATKSIASKLKTEMESWALGVLDMALEKGSITQEEYDREREIITRRLDKILSDLGAIPEK